MYVHVVVVCEFEREYARPCAWTWVCAREQLCMFNFIKRNEVFIFLKTEFDLFLPPWRKNFLDIVHLSQIFSAFKQLGIETGNKAFHYPFPLGQ